MKVNVQLSKRFRRLLHTKNQNCWNNAIGAMSTYPKGTKRLYYVEGYAINARGLPIPIMHGWLEYRGEVIETTPVWLDSHVKHGGNQYFPARKWNRSQLIRRIWVPGCMLPLTKCDWRDQRFLQAREQADRAIMGDAAYEAMRAMLRDDWLRHRAEEQEAA